jgi:hypothetical protein
LDSENRRALQFRCANTGRRFVVVFSRATPTQRFHVVSVVDEKDITGQETPAPGWKAAASQSTGLLLGPTATVAGLLEGAKRFLQTLLRPNGNAPLQRKPRPAKEQAQPSAGSDFDMADFDFTGWYCPCCGHGKPYSGQTRFVRCGRCREYICGGQITRVENGREMFRCHDRCRNSGILGDSVLSSMSGIDLNARKPSELEGGSGQLPPPRRRLTSGKDKK